MIVIPFGLVAAVASRENLNDGHGLRQQSLAYAMDHLE